MQLGSASHILNKPRTSVAPHAAHQHPGICSIIALLYVQCILPTTSTNLVQTWTTDRRANTPSPVGRRELLALTAASVILAAPPSRAEDDVVVAESAPAAASTCLQGGTCTGVCGFSSHMLTAAATMCICHAHRPQLGQHTTWSTHKPGQYTPPLPSPPRPNPVQGFARPHSGI